MFFLWRDLLQAFTWLQIAPLWIPNIITMVTSIKYHKISSSCWSVKNPHHDHLDQSHRVPGPFPFLWILPETFNIVISWLVRGHHHHHHHHHHHRRNHHNHHHHLFTVKSDIIFPLCESITLKSGSKMHEHYFWGKFSVLKFSFLFASSSKREFGIYLKEEKYNWVVRVVCSTQGRPLRQWPAIKE